MRRLKTNRSLLVYILLSLVTCGIYSWYVIYDMARDANEMCAGDGKNTKGLLLYIIFSIITCGLYPYFWYYGIAERMNNACLARGLRSQTSGTSFLLWYILGSFIIVGPFVAMHQLFETMNTVATEYNASRGL